MKTGILNGKRLNKLDKKEKKISQLILRKEIHLLHSNTLVFCKPIVSLVFFKINYNFSKFTDPQTLFEQTLPTCPQCSVQPLYHNLENFHKSSCKCDIGITEDQTKNTECDKYKDTESKSIFGKNFNYDSRESRSIEERTFKPRFGKSKPLNKNQTYNLTEIPTTSKYVQEDAIDLDKEEEENKAHKSNIAKITFKTAKETLLATNPAAKRTLGVTKKANSKFISPMISAQ